MRASRSLASVGRRLGKHVSQMERWSKRYEWIVPPPSIAISMPRSENRRTSTMTPTLNQRSGLSKITQLKTTDQGDGLARIREPSAFFSSGEESISAVPPYNHPNFAPLLSYTRALRERVRLSRNRGAKFSLARYKKETRARERPRFRSWVYQDEPTNLVSLLNRLAAGIPAPTASPSPSAWAR